MLLKESDMNNFNFRVNMSLHFNIIFCFFIVFVFGFWFFFWGGGGGVWRDGSNNKFSRPRPGWAFPRLAIAPCTLLCVCVRRIDTFLVKRAFSFTWQTAMRIFYDKRRRLHKKKELNSHGTGLGHQHGQRFIVLETNMADVISFERLFK